MKLSLRGSWLAAGLLLIALLTVNSRIYVYPDFISVSIGLLAGFYFAGLIVWLVFKNFVNAEKIDKRFSIFAIAAALSLLNIINLL